MKRAILSSRVRRALQGNSGGFTLIEVMIAIAILGVIAIAFLSALATASTVLMVGDERTTAESLARKQLEYVKGQGYKAEYQSATGLVKAIYQKIGGIPEGYSLWSVNRTGGIVEEIIGIPWDSQSNKPAATDEGLQKVALVVIYEDKRMNQDKVIYTFINDNENWAHGVEITLEGYKVDR